MGDQVRRHASTINNHHTPIVNFSCHIPTKSRRTWPPPRKEKYNNQSSGPLMQSNRPVISLATLMSNDVHRCTYRSRGRTTARKACSLERRNRPGKLHATTMHNFALDPVKIVRSRHSISHPPFVSTYLTKSSGRDDASLHEERGVEQPWMHTTPVRQYLGAARIKNLGATMIEE